MAGLMKTMGNKMLGLGKKGLNKVESSLLDAQDQSIFFGARGGREKLVGGKNQVLQAHEQRKAVKQFHNEKIKAINAEENLGGLDPSAFAADKAARISASKDAMRTSQGPANEALIAGGSDMASSVGGFIVGSDRAGQGWGRTRAVATRAGIGIGASMAVGTAGRLATGGGPVHNRNGERDIAGIPMF